MNDYPLMIIDAAQAVEDSKARKDIVKSMVQGDVLRAGVDFGIIPGTDKPTLLKPGAERLCSAFHLDPYFDTVSAIEDFDKPLFFYRVRCHLVHVETRLEIATGIGSCNSKESKYRWRNQNRACPKCGKETIIAGKKEYGGGWLCFQKKGGCGAKFADNAPEIVNQPVGQIENDDIFSIVNTIDKMAQKRALIAAVLIGANASEFFTQDLEDMPGFGVQMEAPTTDRETGEILPSGNSGQKPTQNATYPPSGANPPAQSDGIEKHYTCSQMTVLLRGDNQYQYIAKCGHNLNIVTYTSELYKAALGDDVVAAWKDGVTSKGKVVKFEQELQLVGIVEGQAVKLVRVIG